MSVFFTNYIYIYIYIYIKGGLDRISSFRGGVAGKEGGELFQGRGVAVFT